MNRPAALLLLGTTLLTQSCASEHRSDSASLGALRFDVPAGWHRSETSTRGVQRADWTPADNQRSESIVVVRSELSPSAAKSGAEAVQQLLEHAQASLPKAHVEDVSPFTTKHGMSGARVGVDFTSPDTRALYHRIHVLLVDDKDASFVHVIYTAKNPDPKHEALETVLRTIRHKES